MTLRDHPTAQLWDNRSLKEFTGEEQRKGAYRAGRIPGSRHSEWVTADDRPPASLFHFIQNACCHPLGNNAINGFVEMPASSNPSDWVDRYGDYLFRYAMLRLRDRSAAEDLVQETFLAALKDAGSYSGKSSESTWMVGILNHKIMDHFRRQARESPLEDGDLREQPDPSSFDGAGHWAKGPTDWGGNPADLYREKKFLDQLTKCLSGLSPNHANAFTLREIEGADTGEICKVLNISETNLWVILHRARMQLRRCLETHWFDKSTEEGS